MIMIARVMMIRPSNVMHMAMLGMIGTVIGLGGHRAGPVLQRFHGRSNRQRQGHDHTDAKRPDPCPSYRDCPHPRPLGLAPFAPLPHPPRGDNLSYMAEDHTHASHPAIATRLKRAEGHLRRVIGMIEEGRPCVDLATQLHAVERAVAEAKRALIHDHIDHCLTGGGAHDLAEIKSLTKLL